MGATLLSTVSGGRAATRQGVHRSDPLAGGKLKLCTFQAREREHHLPQVQLAPAGQAERLQLASLINAGELREESCEDRTSPAGKVIW